MIEDDNNVLYCNDVLLFLINYGDKGMFCEILEWIWVGKHCLDFCRLCYVIM